jgi:hypothetical protein
MGQYLMESGGKKMFIMPPTTNRIEQMVIFSRVFMAPHHHPTRTHNPPAHPGLNIPQSPKVPLLQSAWG